MKVQETRIIKPKKRPIRIPYKKGFDLSLVSISLDTIWLVGKLSWLDREELLNSFKFISNKEKYFFQHAHFNPELGLSILINPEHQKHYNVCLKLQNKLIEKPLPSVIKDIIVKYNWMVRRFDIAYDIPLPLELSYSIQHHGNIKNYNRKEWETTLYIGDIRKRWNSISIHYDRNEKERSLKSNKTYEKFNRFELRIRPTLSDRGKFFLEDLVKGNVEKILKQMARYSFIPSILQVKSTVKDRNIIKKVSENYSYLKELKPKDARRIRKIIKENKMPLDVLFLTNREKMFENILK